MTRSLLFPQFGLSRLVPTSPVRKSSRLRMQVFNSHQRSASHRLDCSPTLLPHWICLESVFHNTPTSSLPRDCPRSFGDPAAHPRQSRRRWLPLLKLCMVPFWSWLWSLNRDLVVLSLYNPSLNRNPPSTKWRWVIFQSAIVHTSWIWFPSSAAAKILIKIVNISITSSSRFLIWMRK